MSELASSENEIHLIEFIEELAEQEGITFQQAVQLAIETIREHSKALGQ